MPPARRDAIVRHLDAYLQADAFQDYAPNGLQVEGAADVEKVVAGVSASLQLFREAVDRGADMVLVHHGMLWDNEPRPITGPTRERVKLLLDHDVSLVAYHLPLDAHHEVGNNFVAARALGLTELQPWAEHGGQPIGCRGRLPEPADAPAFLGKAADYFGHEVARYAGGPDQVETVGIVTGGAQGDARAATAAGLDCFITGEVSEWNKHHALEWGLHFLACGHYATERVGVLALGEHVAKEFGVDVAFVEVENAV